MNPAVSPLPMETPLTLTGVIVRLEPIRREHQQLFWEVAQNDLEDIFRWIPYAMRTPDDFRKLVDKALAEQDRGESVVFATLERSSGRVIGSTRFMNIDRTNRRVEIGSTWIATAGPISSGLAGWCWLTPRFWPTPFHAARWQLNPFAERLVIAPPPLETE